MSLAMEYTQTVEIDTGDLVRAVTFSANGEYLVSGGKKGIQVRRVKDGEQVATIQESDVRSVAVSKDGKFIAVGSDLGDVWLWKAMTYEKVSAHKLPCGPVICDVDFSPDSRRLVSADGENCTATIWDLTTRKKVQTLDHRDSVLSAKYSPQGERIATASLESVRVWDSKGGRLLVDVKVGMYPRLGLLWFDNHIFVKPEDSKIRQIDASTGSTVSEWTVPRDSGTCIALPQHGRFIAYSTEDNVTLWDTSSRTQLGLIPRNSRARAIALSPDNQLLAFVAQKQKIVINDLPFIGSSHEHDSLSHIIHKELDTCIEGGPLRARKNGQLTEAEELLTAILRSNDAAHDVLASRAPVVARLQQWGKALGDAEESQSIKIQSSTFAYIAKCVALGGKGGARAVCRLCDVASLRFHSDHIAILLLVKAVVLFMAGEHDDAMSRLDDLIAVGHSDSTTHVVQAHMLLLRGSLYMESGDYNRAIQSFEDARLKLGDRKERPPSIITLISGWEFDDLAIVIQQRLCEALFAARRIDDMRESVLRIVGGEICMSESLKTWVSNFTQRCLSAPQSNEHPMTPLLTVWAKLRLATVSWNETLASTDGFTFPRATIYQVICDSLEIIGHAVDAASCYHQMCGEVELGGDRIHWIREFKCRCSGTLANHGDVAMDAKEYDKAILQYTTALSLNPDTLQDLLGRRSKAHASKGEWGDALDDADELIKLDPSSPLGYERKHVALHGLGRPDDAINTFKMMLSRIFDSFDSLIQERYSHYIKAKETIRINIENTIRDSPPVLIDTTLGRLCDKSEQASAFETTLTFTELILSLTTQTGRAHIEDKVRKYFRYATFSHKWENNEPLFEKVIRVVVFDLEASPTHEKLKMFCKIVREAGFNWAWSDTCCINKGDHFVLQEALVSMFKWYERSAMTIIFLREVNSRGALTRSIWNTRAWTLQEYHASKVVQFYTKDWTPYLGLEIYNHKDSPEIISEMEKATGISAEVLMELRPGHNRIREKLRIASMRQTTRIEDTAYSLLGIFSLSLSITYGEGDKALGRLLSQLLASSGDMSILAWTGKSGSFNSCLPSSITVFNQSPTSHIPPTLSGIQMCAITARVPLANLALLTTLYERVSELLVPWFSARRMKLPCLAFKVERISIYWKGAERVFHAHTDALGIVEIRTDEDLSRLSSLCLVHPWIDFLLDRQPIEDVMVPIVEENSSSIVVKMPSFPSPSNTSSTARQTRATWFGYLGLSFGGRPASDSASPQPSSTLSAAENQGRILRFIARLMQPFGALLFAPTRQNMEEYRRIATQSLITVQVNELTPAVLETMISNVRMLDVL